MSAIPNDLQLHPGRSGPVRRNAARASSLLFGAFAVAVIIRFAVPGNVLNLFEQYSSFNQINSSGSIVGKIHPGSYGIIAITIVMLPRILAKWTKDYDGVMNSLFIMAAAIVVVSVICVFTGQTASIGYMVDSMLVACAAGACALCFSAPQRRSLGISLLVITIISSAIAIMEFAAKTHFLPQEVMASEGATSIRADGLFVHPLDLGLYSAVAIPILSLTGWSHWIKAAITSILILGIFAAGARVAAIAAITMVVFGLLFTKRSRIEMGSLILEKTVVIAGLLLLIPIMWFAASSLGLTERFQQEGLTDDSAMARIIIFQVFGFMEWSDLIWGVGNLEMYKFAALGLNIDSVENSLIVYVFQFGLIGAFLIVGSMARTALALARDTQFPLKMALLAFFMIAITNNTLSVKSPSLLFIIILAIAFRRSAAAERANFSRPRPSRDGFRPMPAQVRPPAE